jgi:hypothetical protein
MKPFVIFRAPDKVRWAFRPVGKKRFRFEAWVMLPYSNAKVVQQITTKEALTITDLMPLLNEAVNVVMDELQCELYEYWSTFLLSITDNTTDEEIDHFHDSVPESKYGFEAYVWS